MEATEEMRANASALSRLFRTNPFLSRFVKKSEQWPDVPPFSFPNRYGSRVYSMNDKCIYNSLTNTYSDKIEFRILKRGGLPMSENSRAGYMWAIPADDPRTIVYSKEMPLGDTQTYVPCDPSLRLGANGYARAMNRLYHDDLVKSNNVVCAGMLYVDKIVGTIIITNRSGHYHPDPSCLQYAKKLFAAYGYDVSILPI